MTKIQIYSEGKLYIINILGKEKHKVCRKIGKKILELISETSQTTFWTSTHKDDKKSNKIYKSEEQNKNYLQIIILANSGSRENPNSQFGDGKTHQVWRKLAKTIGKQTKLRWSEPTNFKDKAQKPQKVSITYEKPINYNTL